jgi:site-specific DNA-methyltransferase (adenine-specific)
MLKPEKKTEKIEGEARQKGDAPCMVLFCAFDQQMYFIELGKRYGLNNYINLVFRKNFSAQVLKANMKIVGNSEYGLVFYRDKLPKFRNNGKMIFNIMDWGRNTKYEKIHPTQKPVELLEKIITIFTDEGDVVIDPVAGSGSSLVAAENLGRKAHGFEIKKDLYRLKWQLDKVLESAPTYYGEEQWLEEQEKEHVWNELKK